MGLIIKVVVGINNVVNIRKNLIKLLYYSKIYIRTICTHYFFIYIINKIIFFVFSGTTILRSGKIFNNIIILYIIFFSLMKWIWDEEKGFIKRLNMFYAQRRNSLTRHWPSTTHVILMTVGDR